jgi:hypothetical protein
MLPWSAEFVFDFGHVAFFGAFYAVLLALVVVAGLSLRRARVAARAGRGPAVAWRAAFAELGSRDRACRHQLTGEAPGRVCDQGFDCRGCATHPRLAALAPPAPRPAPAALALMGLELPPDRLYHRGHCYVKPEADGTVTVGLDDLARRMVGKPEAVELPAPGDRVTVNGPAFRMWTRGREVRVLCPVDGVVTQAGAAGGDVVLRVDPGGPLDSRHLLAGDEVAPWALRELERLLGLLRPGELGPALADGGELVSDVAAQVPPERLDGLLGEMFLDL